MLIDLNQKSVDSFHYFIKSKNYRKLIKVRILKFVYKFNIISDSQYIFRKHLSTFDKLYDITGTVNLNVEYLKNDTIVSVDLCKALDTLYHKILIQKLNIC